MSIQYNLATPIQVGGFGSQISVSSLKLVSISVNYEDVYAKDGKAMLSVCLVDTVSGYPVNVVYKDGSALTVAQLIEQQIGTEILLKLSGDGKLPAGQIVNT